MRLQPSDANRSEGQTESTLKAGILSPVVDLGTRLTALAHYYPSLARIVLISVSLQYDKADAINDCVDSIPWIKFEDLMLAMPIKCIVTGGSGFLGRHLILRLHEHPEKWMVTNFDITPPNPPLAVPYICGDLCNFDSVRDAFEGVEVVFHCATAAPSASNAANEELMHRVNVKGTENVVRACRECNVPKLIYTSSASVVFEGKDLLGVDEGYKVKGNWLDYYTRTKAEAEEIVLGANGTTLATVALRPSGIFGEYDRLFLPSLIDTGKQGKSKYMIGDGKNLFDFTYVGNVAQAHELAAKALDISSKAAGQVYFITNDETRTFWGTLGDFLEPLGFDRPRISIPFAVAYVIAFIMSLVLSTIKPIYTPKKAPVFTCPRTILLTCHRKVSCEKAKRDLGYSPETPMDKAIGKTVQYFREILTKSI